MNRFSLQISLILILSSFIVPLHSMECALAEIKREQEKPIIKVTMRIDHDYKPYYAQDSCYGYIESNSTILVSRNMPAIPVIISFINNYRPTPTVTVWNEENCPSEILKFEVQSYKQKMGVTGFSVEEAKELLKKIRKERCFFAELPIMFVLTAKTGSLLKCDIFGYPIEITCWGNKKIIGEFEDDFKEKIDAFICKPHVFHDILFFKSSSRACLDKKLIAINPDSQDSYVGSSFDDYVHGENSVIHRVRNFLDFSRGKSKSNETILFLLSLIESIQSREIF